MVTQFVSVLNASNFWTSTIFHLKFLVFFFQGNNICSFSEFFLFNAKHAG